MCFITIGLLHNKLLDYIIILSYNFVYIALFWCMTRPSRNLDQRMIDAGIEILTKHGLKSLSINSVCKLADVNTGMFNYCFAKKEYFLIEVLKKMVADFNKIITEKQWSDDIPTKFAEYADLLFAYATENVLLMHAMFIGVMREYDNLAGTFYEIGCKDERCFAIITECQNAGYITSKIPAFEIVSMLLKVFIPSIAMYNLSQEEITTIKKHEFYLIIEGLKRSNYEH